MRIVGKLAPYVIVIIGIYLIVRGFTLVNEIPMVDGTGIGLYLLGIEINDRLLTNEIPSTALIIAIVGTMLTVAPLCYMLSQTLRNFKNY
ncbi:hypothetical protein FZW96_07565 [Bacillus sp. BGMRC 2118]|nr:hypothetical protein FZW96_07565 [Bacillus sp. BGMRC 2118]